MKASTLANCSFSVFNMIILLTLSQQGSLLASLRQPLQLT